MLAELISWRKLSEQDIANVDMDAPTCLNDEEMFPRNAIKRLFNYYYRAKNTTEIERFAELIIGKCDESEDHCAFYRKEFYKIVTFLIRSGDLPKAKSLCERYLAKSDVLDQNLLYTRGVMIYVHGFPEVIMKQYLNLLAKMGETESAMRLVDECIKDSRLTRASRIVFEGVKQKLSGKTSEPRYQIIKVTKDALKSSHKAKGRVELIALSYLQEALDMEGMFAEVDIWRLLPLVITHRLSRAEFKAQYKEITTLKLPEDAYDFVLHNQATFRDVFRAKNITFGRVGYPDLILYNRRNYRDFVLIEVKDVNDRLSASQQARIEYFLDKEIPFRLFQFAR